MTVAFQVHLCIIDNDNMLNIANTDTFNGININQLFHTKAVQQVSPTRQEWSGVYKNYKGVRVLGTSMFEPESHF